MAISKIKGSAIQDATIPEEKLEDEAGSFRMILDGTDGSATNAGDFVLLDATASSTNVGEQFLFEPATDDGSAVLSGDLNLENFKLSEMDKNSTIKSAGGAATTNIGKGLTTQFAAYDLATSGLAVSYDTLNTAGYTDVGTGQQGISYTNNFATARGRTTHGGIGNVNDLTTFALSVNPVNAADMLTGSIEVASVYSSGSDSAVFDYLYQCVSSMGDLA